MDVEVDLVSVERQSGRLRLLLSLPDGAHVWRRRVALRYGLLFACLAVPVAVGAAVAGAALGNLSMVLVVAASYLAFWVGLALLIAARGWRSVANATALMGAWVLLTLVLPTLTNVALVRTIPVHQGVDLMLAQRQAVHGAWEIDPCIVSVWQRGGLSRLPQEPAGRRSGRRAVHFAAHLVLGQTLLRGLAQRSM